LVVCLDPLVVYLYNEGIARFCSEIYQPPSKANRDMKFIHLTNTAINVENKGVLTEAFAKKSSEVIEMIMNRDRRGVDLHEKINEAVRNCYCWNLTKNDCFSSKKRIFPALIQRSIIKNPEEAA
jgi:predicted RNA-binding protein